MNILIVESNAKCKTLLRFLGDTEWRVLSTGGPVETLPNNPNIHPPSEPDGFDVEVFSFEALRRSFQHAKKLFRSFRLIASLNDLIASLIKKF